jgi:hypothetical protein
VASHSGDFLWAGEPPACVPAHGPDGAHDMLRDFDLRAERPVSGQVRAARNLSGWHREYVCYFEVPPAAELYRRSGRNSALAGEQGDGVESRLRLRAAYRGAALGRSGCAVGREFRDVRARTAELNAMMNQSLHTAKPFGKSDEDVGVGEAENLRRWGGWMRPLLLVVNSTLSNTVPFGHSVLRHVAFSKLGLRSPAGRSTRRKRSRAFPSAGPN